MNHPFTDRQETGGGEGVEVVKNEPFEGLDFLGGKYTKGQYTYKIYHVDTKVPPLLRLVRNFTTYKGGYLEERFCKYFSECSICMHRLQGSCSTTA